MLLASLILVANEALIPKCVLATMQKSLFPNWFGTIVGEISTRRKLRGDHVKLSNPMAARLRVCVVLCLSVATVLVLPLFALPSGGDSRPWGQQITGVPNDWTHQHLVFSNPGTEEEAIRNGTYDDWVKIVNNPRYLMQQLRRHAPAQGPAAQEVARIEAAAAATSRSGGRNRMLLIKMMTMSLGLSFAVIFLRRRHWIPTLMVVLSTAIFLLLASCSGPVTSSGSALNKDWGEGILTGAVLPNTYPAKYTFNPIGAATCATDYVVYPTGSTGSGTKATIIAYNNLYVTGTGALCSGGAPLVYWAYNTGGTTYAVTTSPILSSDGTKVAFIQSNGSAAQLVVLKWAQTPATITANGNLTSNSTSITGTTGISAADVGMQISDTTHAGCIPANDTIAAFSGTTVTLATATSGTCGTQTGDSLILTTEAVGTPGVPPSGTPSSCTAPCMATLAFSDSHNDTYSSPYYDYSNDALYVGDNNSYLHKFTGVFTGTPTEATAVQLNTTAYDVASPVYDPVSGCVFVGDSEGYFYSVDSGTSTTASVCKSGSFTLFGHSELLGGGAADDGIFDAPLVDSAGQMVYAFVTDSAHISNCAAGDNCIVQFQTSTITSGTSTAAPNNEEPLGTGGQNYNLYAGAFDNVYFTSATPSNPSGHIYVVGGTDLTTGALLYQVPINANVMAAATSEATVNATHQPWPTPVTEFFNANVGGGTDFIFFSAYRGNLGSCSTVGSSQGCIFAFNVTTPTSVSLSSSALITFPGGAGEAGCWGTSAFIIDNSSTSTGASQVYFTNFNGNYPSAGTANCASSSSTTTNTLDATQDSQSAL